MIFYTNTKLLRLKSLATDTRLIPLLVNHQSSVGKSMGTPYPHGSWVWVLTGMGTGITLSTHDPCVMTVRLGLSFFFHLLPSPLSFVLYYGHPPVAPCNSLELDLPSNTKARTRCLVDCAPSPLSITCLTHALTVLPTRASVPANVHPLCPLCARISSLLPYVSLHPLCMLPDPLTCVVPCPLYAFS